MRPSAPVVMMPNSEASASDTGRAATETSARLARWNWIMWRRSMR